MKILDMVSNPGIGGTETLIFSTIPYFERMGCRVDILNTWRDSMMKEPAIKAGFSYRELGGKSRIIRFRDIIELVRIIRRNNYDIVQVFGLRLSIILRLLKPFFGNPPLVIGLHGLDFWRKWYHIWADRLTKNLCDMFVPISDNVAKMYTEREKIPANKMVVIKNGVDLDEYDRIKFANVDRRSLSLPENKIIVTTLANFRYVKGHDFYIDVIEAFFKEFQNVHFVWIGRGPSLAALESKIKAISASDKITILKSVEDVRPILTCSDIFVLPSRAEGMPRALMEAMAMSVPSVATNVGGVNEVIENEVSGFIADFGDIKNFGQYIIRLVNDKDLRRRIGLAAKERIAKEFDMEKIAKKHIRLFELLIAGYRNGREIQGMIDI